MKRYILFSNPTEFEMEEITSLLFSKEMENKVLAYMPAEELDLPHEDFIPSSLEEEIVTYADNFHTKKRGFILI